MASRFQAKSVEQIQRLQTRGVTSILVSHDLEIIRKLADQVIWLRDGRITTFGPTASVVSAYLAATILESESDAWNLVA